MNKVKFSIDRTSIYRTILIFAVVSSFILPVYAKKPERQPKLDDVVLEGAIIWSGQESVSNNKVGIGLRVYFRNEDPNALDLAVGFVGSWPGMLSGDTPEALVCVVPSDHLAVNVWWPRAKQMELARMSLAFWYEGEEWLLKAEGNDFTPIEGGIEITLLRASLNKIGDPIPGYEELEGPLVFRMLFS